MTSATMSSHRSVQGEPSRTVWKLTLAIAVMLFTFTGVGVAEGLAFEEADERPNIIVVLVDDMGWSDLGCYGGEIETPVLDRMASEGLRFNQFYNCAKCETTRATLLTGQYHPEVGVAKLEKSLTLAEVLQGAGYQTWMTGKWHMKGHPLDRGFERYFGHLSGSTNFFVGDNTFYRDREPYKVPSEGFYTTDANTDYAMDFVRERDSDKPFFLYLAHNAPHYPLQAPKEDVEKYRGRYLKGWDNLRETRLSRIRQLGLLPDNTQLSPRPSDVPAWDSVPAEDRDQLDMVMATYAGMIDRIDQNMGRLLECLEQEGALDNTLILFFSDNGACPFQRTKAPTLENQWMPWDSRSYWTYDQRWANACNTPFRAYKQNQHEGGIRTPMIAYWPKSIEGKGRIVKQPGHLVDVMATVIDLAKTTYPNQDSEREAGALRGTSLQPIFEGLERAPNESLFFTFYGKNNAIRVGNWKLVNRDFGPWELYNLQEDPVELNDLSKKNPAKRQELVRRWKELASEMGVQRKRPKPKPKNDASK